MPEIIFGNAILIEETTSNALLNLSTLRLFDNQMINLKEKTLSIHQVQLLKNSFRKMDSLRVAKNFYSSLFTEHPETSSLFASDLNVQMEKMVSVLELVIFSFEEKSNLSYGLQDSLIVPLRGLGKQHAEIGVKPEHYSIANSLLLRAIEEEIGPLFSDDLKISWEIALDKLSFAMLDSSVDHEITVKNPIKTFFNQIFNGLWKYVK